MRIIDLERDDRAGGHRFEARIETAAGDPVPLFFEVSPRVDGLALDRADPFLLPALMFAMERNEDLEVDAPISKRLAANLPDIAQLFSTLLAIPRVPRLDLRTFSEENAQPAPGFLTGLSGGVDSFTVLTDYFWDAAPPQGRITHTVFNDVGAHGRGDDTMFITRKVRVEVIAEEIGLPLIVVRSNIAALTALNFEHTFTARNASVAHLFGSICSEFLHASGRTFNEIGVRPLRPMAFADPILLPLFSSDLVMCQATGTRYRRVDKIARIANNPLVQRHLDVCAAHNAPHLFEKTRKINCSQCLKCMPTQLTLEIMGLLEDFRQVFDLDIYRARRRNYAVDVLTRPDTYHTELIDFAREHGFDLHGIAGLRRYFSPLAIKNRMPAAIKRPLKRLLKIPV